MNNDQFSSLVENGKSVFVKESGFGDDNESMDQIVLCESQKERGDGLKMGSDSIYESANQSLFYPSCSSWLGAEQGLRTTITL